MDHTWGRTNVLFSKGTVGPKCMVLGPIRAASHAIVSGPCASGLRAQDTYSDSGFHVARTFVGISCFAFML